MATKKGLHLACYDSGPNRGFDRYTVVFLVHEDDGRGHYLALTASADPFHPQGFGQHVICPNGRHLGKPVPFNSLPADVQAFALMDLCPEGWQITRKQEG